MTANFHTPIINGDPRKNDAAIWNDPYGTIDAELSNNSSELDAARGSYPSIGARFDSLVLSGGNVQTLANGFASSGQKVVNVDSATGFLAGGRVGYTLASGQIEYNTISLVNSAVQFTLGSNIGISGISDNNLITMISESEYQAAQAIYSGGTASSTLPTTVEWLDREINVKAFGAIGDGIDHVVSGGGLAAAQAAFPLTQAAFGIGAADQYDWCAIQEAVLTAGQVSGVNIENVYIPVGQYRVNRTIVVPLVAGLGRSMTITGGGFRGSSAGATITATVATSIFLIPGFTTIQQLSLVGSDITNTASIGIRIGGLTTAVPPDPWSHNNCVHVTIDRVYFNGGFYRCISALYEVDQLKITHCTSGGVLGQAVILLSNDHVTNVISPSAGVVIESCAFANNVSVTGGDALYGIYLMGTENSAIRNCVIRGYDNVIYLTGTAGGNVRNDGLVIENIHSEINQPLKAGVGNLANRWTPATAYTSGTFIRPAQAGANGWWYKCTLSGTSAANSIRNSANLWTASARGTGEYYLTTSGGTDPGITQPSGVMENGTPMTYSFAGGLLLEGQWGYGNNDGLAFNTIYVRIVGSTNPHLKANHYLWTTGNEPVWPTTYGATVNDNATVWTAYKQANFLRVAAPVGAVTGGLQISGVWCENFNTFILAEQATSHDITRIYVNGCTVRTTDMIYNERSALRKAVIFENCYLEGCIKPFSALTAVNAQTSVLLRFCSRANDYTGALGNALHGVASWFTNEPVYSYESDEVPNNVDFQLDPRLHSQITVSTGTSGTPVKVYVPYFTSTAFINGLRGKTITITHGDGTDGLTVEFNSNQPLVHGAGTTTSLSLPRPGDSVTIRLASLGTGPTRWTVVGSHAPPASGTWNPVVTSTGTASTVTCSPVTADYRIVGDMCFYNFNLVIATLTLGTGNIRVSLPLVASAALQPRGTALTDGFDITGTVVNITFTPISSSSTGQFLATVDNAAVSAQPIAGLAVGDTLAASGFYFI